MNTKKDREKIITRRAHSLLVVLGGGAGLAIAMQGLLSFALPAQTETSVNNAGDAREEIRTAKIANPFDGISLEARAGYVLELKTGVVLFAKNENEKLPLASVTKLMTAFVAREHLSESAVLTLTKDDLSAEGDSGLRPGERWRLGDILNAMLLVSSNDAAHAVALFVGSNGVSDRNASTDIARANFVQMMNEKAVLLGLEQMQFFNESGLDVSAPQSGQLAQVSILPQGGGYGSARNVALLFAELWKKYPETIEITAHKDARIYSQDEIAHILPNTNEIVGQIPGLVASKTGYTNISGGNLAVIFDRGIGDPIVAVVLGSSYKGRFDDMQKLVEATRK
ncbi:MAG: Penicillin-binding protein dacF [Parcubacteria group bacterium GW2011_GWA1_44_13]|uniref:Penicillin-binding protein dacF n=1 Tax=Candidatus Nomurabacteria bacterium GW2011_GWB1_44_12 TaxID=1618748 RepID=A0A837IED6_9BACT|nr:MAG: Penicillin-binding protein dacF [Candidatus Nomurabacteria bacterium GW2011_GWB1_44_12]KKT38583.1 MAG: Penicillin-binding protein dacF [Parcubacteria group bacterium GW2011_GWA1_44_13]